MQDSNRETCWNCRQPKSFCFCRKIRRVDPKINFIVLVHPREGRKHIATARMVHLCLEGSKLFLGENFSDHRAVNEIIARENAQSFILYPGAEALNLSDIPAGERQNLCASDPELNIFIIDGTWSMARKMLRVSRNLQCIKRICFTPPHPSSFRVREQPNAQCFSTVEAAHQVIELLGEARGFSINSRSHDILLDIFDGLVEQQLHYVPAGSKDWKCTQQN